MGVQENSGDNPAATKEKNSILELQRKCFSCCGYPASTLSAFKMACLTYNPSPIKIDNREYKREELLEFTTNMLHNIKRSIQGQGTEASVKDLNVRRQSIEETIEKGQFETYEQSKMLGKVDS